MVLYWNTLIEVGGIAEDGTRKTDGAAEEKVAQKEPAHEDAVQKHADAIAASQLTEQGATVGLGAAAGRWPTGG